jgi:serine/threonine protein kinase
MGCSASSEVSAVPPNKSSAPTPAASDARQVAAAAMHAAESRNLVSATAVDTKGILTGGSVRVPRPNAGENPPLLPSIDVRSVYEFGGVLGSGAFGTVYRVVPIGSPPGTAPLACKSIPKRKLLSDVDIEDVRREVQIMSHLAHHPHVVELVGSYEDARDIHLVMQVCA